MLSPSEWRNGALIQFRKGKSPARSKGAFFKLVWGQQFGFGVWTSQHSPNATGKSHISNDPGCPQGCLL